MPTTILNSVTSDVSPLPTSQGGTGAGTLTANGILLGAGTSAVTATTLANNQVLLGQSSGAPLGTYFGSFTAPNGNPLTVSPGGRYINNLSGSILDVSIPTDHNLFPVGSSFIITNTQIETGEGVYINISGNQGGTYYLPDGTLQNFFSGSKLYLQGYGSIEIVFAAIGSAPLDLLNIINYTYGKLTIIT